jgi:hypothetical protein
MRKAEFICLIGLFGILSNTIYSQSDSFGNGNVKSSKLYYSSGGGFGSRGSTFGLGGTFVSSNNWGGSFSYKTNILKSKDVPIDYYDDGRRSFAPRDYLSYISLNLVKEFITSGKQKRFGIEAGPAWVKYNIAQFERNMSYDPSASPWFGNIYKYHKTHTARKTIGLTLRAETEFWQTRFSKFEFAVFTNINSIQSVLGLEFYLCLGKVRD